MDDRPPGSARAHEATAPPSTLAARHALNVRLVARRERVREILGLANERDARADERDTVADRRDSAAGLQSFLHDDEYAAALRARRGAARDRLAAKADRDSAAADRVRLAEDGPTRPEPVG